MKKAVEFLKENPWMVPSFLVAFTAVMFDIMKLQKDVRYTEAELELVVTVRNCRN